MNNTTSKNAAVIDIGSNSVRYMEAAITGNTVTAVFKELATTRLAEGINVTGKLSSVSVERSLTAIQKFAMQANAQHLPIYAYATSAVRDAKNREDFCTAVYACSGVLLDVLSGEEEAALAFLGAAKGNRNAGLIDIGGGSAQVITSAYRNSWPIGCVRIRERYVGIPYPDALPMIAAYLTEHCELPTLAPAHWVGVGGSITTLAALQAGLIAYDPAQISAVSITPTSLSAQIKSLSAMGDARRAHPLLRERHDLILYGAAVLLWLMDTLHVTELHASDADGMEGYLMYKLGFLPSAG